MERLYPDRAVAFLADDGDKPYVGPGQAGVALTLLDPPGAEGLPQEELEADMPLLLEGRPAMAAYKPADAAALFPLWLRHPRALAARLAGDDSLRAVRLLLQLTLMALLLIALLIRLSAGA